MTLSPNCANCGSDIIVKTPLGSIVDVPGIGVGHHQRVGRGWQTGTTVVAAPGGATPGVNVRGGGPGTRETDALHPENLIQTIHAVTLTGGSAYGLAAADGVVEVLEEAGLGFPIAEHVVPVVPGAVIFDLGRGGSFTNRPDRTFGYRAARRALARRPTPGWGAVGAGTGARAGGLQGGVGTASQPVRVGDFEYIVGALAVVNANGSAIDPVSGIPWEPSGLGIKRPSGATQLLYWSSRNQPQHDHWSGCCLCAAHQVRMLKTCRHRSRRPGPSDPTSALDDRRRHGICACNRRRRRTWLRRNGEPASP